MSYQFFTSAAKASEAVKHHRAQGRRAYWAEISVNSFEVRSWA